MDTVVVTRAFEENLEGLVAYCRSLNSRSNWPGAVLEFSTPGTLYFSVGMRLRSASLIDVGITERLGEVVREAPGEVRFDTVQRGIWPDGHCDATSEYLFTRGQDGGAHTLRLTYTYTAPSTNLVRPRELAVFGSSMERVLATYLTQLTTGVLVGS